MRRLHNHLSTGVIRLGYELVTKETEDQVRDFVIDDVRRSVMVQVNHRVTQLIHNALVPTRRTRHVPGRVRVVPSRLVKRDVKQKIVRLFYEQARIDEALRVRQTFSAVSFSEGVYEASLLVDEELRQYVRDRREAREAVRKARRIRGKS